MKELSLKIALMVSRGIELGFFASFATGSLSHLAVSNNLIYLYFTMKLRIESASNKLNKILFHEFSTNAFSLMQIVSVALKEPMIAQR